jgi:hypothetical protein
MHRSDIDGLRAVAVLMVLVFHFDLFPAGSAGFVGVDVFFVISGFFHQLSIGKWKLGLLASKFSISIGLDGSLLRFL